MTKHTILFLAANPLGTDRLALDEEARAIQAELERSGHGDRFALVTRWAVRPLDLLRELRKLKPTIVHFSGHGARGAIGPGSGAQRDMVGAVDEINVGLYVVGTDGRPQFVSTAALEETFGAAGRSVKVVVLSACYGAEQAEALVQHIACVVATSGAIGDDAARAFAIGFYGGIGEGESVVAAFRQGRAAMALDGLPNQQGPWLTVHRGCDAEELRFAEVGAVGPWASTVQTTQKAGLAKPTPAYPDADAEALSKRIVDARERKERLRSLGAATDQIDREILDLRRQFREGGQLRAGDALGDGRYLLLGIVGRGGFAVVWEAYDCREQQRVAIKVLHSNLAGDPLCRERFFRGARAMIELRDSAVVRVLYPKGEDGGFCFFVMELVSGGNLRTSVLDGHVEDGAVLPIIISVGKALAMAHLRGMVHRDVKPSNILLDEIGDPKLTDFDVVLSSDTTGGTRTGALGTFLYSAPECLDRPQDATPRADVYSLGMTAIFGISGRELTLATIRDPAMAIEGLTCSAQVKAVLRRAVSWEARDRFLTCVDLSLALSDAIDACAPTFAAGDPVLLRGVVSVTDGPEMFDVALDHPAVVGPAASLGVAPGLVDSTELLGAGSKTIERTRWKSDQVQSILAEADAYIRYGLPQKAISELRRVFTLDADNVEARERLKYIFLSQGREQDAEVELLKLAELAAPGDPERAELYLQELFTLNSTHTGAFELARRFRLRVSQ